MHPVVSQRAVDLVRNHPGAIPVHEPGNGRGLGAAEGLAERIVRIRQQQCARPGPQSLFDAGQIQDPTPARFDEPDLDDFPAHRTDQFEEGHVGGHRQDHGTAGLAERVDPPPDPGEHFRQDPHRLGLEGPVIAGGTEFGQGRRQRRLPWRGVAEGFFLYRPVEFVDDHRSGGEIHLRDPERQHVLRVEIPFDPLPGAQRPGCGRTEIETRWLWIHSAMLRANGSS